MGTEAKRRAHAKEGRAIELLLRLTCKRIGQGPFDHMLFPRRLELHSFSWNIFLISNTDRNIIKYYVDAIELYMTICHFRCHRQTPRKTHISQSDQKWKLQITLRNEKQK